MFHGPLQPQTAHPYAPSPDAPELHPCWQPCYLPFALVSFISTALRCVSINTRYFQSHVSTQAAVPCHMKQPKWVTSAMSIDLLPLLQPLPQGISHHPGVCVQSWPLSSLSSLQSQLDGFHLHILTQFTFSPSGLHDLSCRTPHSSLPLLMVCYHTMGSTSSHSIRPFILR